MDIKVSLPDDEAGDDLRRLAQWLRDDDDLKGVSITLLDHTRKSHEMGIADEAIQIAFQQNGIFVALTGVLGTWLGAPNKRTKLRVKVGDKEIEIDASKMSNPEEVAKDILRQLGE